ncbi:hypothetical protein CEXT_6431 [Caerostris extrusa]|uniref:Uncharacterized protein n=1 Tax=Caerostris extrusa TaxID=172846 RepID=A0AAV4U4U6_CAEEX|nr:hypothetical protein CEXT_6431 [Caerostris extrusa]
MLTWEAHEGTAPPPAGRAELGPAADHLDEGVPPQVLLQLLSGVTGVELRAEASGVARKAHGFGPADSSCREHSSARTMMLLSSVGIV